MKRLFTFLSLASILFMAPEAHSQQVMKNSIDSLVNATTGYATLPVMQSVDFVTITLVLTKATTGGGTVGGTALPQGSIDNITYFDLSTDTLKLQNQNVNQKAWSFDKAKWRYYRTAVTTTGTQKASRYQNYLRDNQRSRNPFDQHSFIKSFNF